MAYYGNNVYNEKSYKIAVRRSKKQQKNNKKNVTSSTLKNENSIKNNTIPASNNEFNEFNELNQKNLINIPKAYRFFKQRKVEEYKENGKYYSRSDLEKHIQRDWKNSPENPLNQQIIKENMNFTNKCSLKKITHDNKKDFKKTNKNNSIYIY